MGGILAIFRNVVWKIDTQVIHQLNFKCPKIANCQLRCRNPIRKLLNCVWNFSHKVIFLHTGIYLVFFAETVYWTSNMVSHYLLSLHLYWIVTRKCDKMISCILQRYTNWCELKPRDSVVSAKKSNAIHFARSAITECSNRTN